MTGSRNIELPVNDECAFCAYLKGERPYTIFFREELAAILVTREQRGVSHLLVVPTRHCETILDLTEAESAVVMREIRHAAHVIDLADGRPGIAVWQNNGVPANQTISHVHFHIAGTLETGGTNWGKVPELTVEETDAISDKLHRAEGSLLWACGLPALRRFELPFDLIFNWGMHPWRRAGSPRPRLSD